MPMSLIAKGFRVKADGENNRDTQINVILSAAKDQFACEDGCKSWKSLQAHGPSLFAQDDKLINPCFPSGLRQKLHAGGHCANDKSGLGRAPLMLAQRFLAAKTAP